MNPLFKEVYRQYWYMFASQVSLWTQFSVMSDDLVENLVYRCKLSFTQTRMLQTCNYKQLRKKNRVTSK